MNGKEIICPHCEAEFYIETADGINFCPQCGEELVDEEYEEIDFED